MASKGLSISWVGALVAGGMFWLVGQCSSASAAQPTAKVLPAPPSAAATTTEEQLKPIPQSSSPADDTSLVGEELPSPEYGGLLAGDPCEMPYDEECLDGCSMAVCSPPGRFWMRADALIWWTSGTTLPPLVTTSPQGTAAAQAGVLPAATILFGNRVVGDDGRGGIRTTFGMWLDHCRNWNLEFDYLTLGQRENNYNATSSGNPILARPFFNVKANAQASQLVAYPNQLVGTITAGAKNNYWSSGVLLSYNLCSSDSCGSCDPCNDGCEDFCEPAPLFCCRTDLLVGFRHHNFSDSVMITEDLRVTQSGATQNTTYQILDNFRSRNEFFGSEIGLRTHIYRGRWSMKVLAKIGIGNTHETVSVAGQTVVTANGSALTYNAGILASGTNSGLYTRDQFTLIPQLGFELGYQVTHHLRAYVGYDVLYWGSVARASDQLDLNLDPRNFSPQQTGGLPFPAFPAQQSAFWAQGISLGAEFRF